MNCRCCRWRCRVFRRGSGPRRWRIAISDYSGLGEAVSETAQDALMTLDGEAQSQLSHALILALVSDIALGHGNSNSGRQCVDHFRI